MNKPTNNGHTQKVYGYPRVSTNEQTVSIDSQSAMIEARAKSLLGTKWAGNFPEQESAAKVRYYERPVFRLLMELLKPGDTLIIWRLDRLDRSAFAIVRGLEWLAEHQVRLIILYHGGMELDLNTTTGKIIAMFLAGFAEFDNDLRRAATREAMQWRKANGWAHAPCTFGFRFQPLPKKPGQTKPLKAIVPDDVDTIQEIVRRRDAGEGFYQIAGDLARRGVKHKGEPWVKRRSAKERHWNTYRLSSAYALWKHLEKIRFAKRGELSAEASVAISASSLEAVQSSTTTPSGFGLSEPPSPVPSPPVSSPDTFRQP